LVLLGAERERARDRESEEEERALVPLVVR